MAAISLNSLVTGYFWLNGINYCTNPTVMYILGSVAVCKSSQLNIYAT